MLRTVRYSRAIEKMSNCLAPKDVSHKLVFDYTHTMSGTKEIKAKGHKMLHKERSLEE